MVSNTNFEKTRSPKRQRRNAHNLEEGEFAPNLRRSKKRKRK